MRTTHIAMDIQHGDRAAIRNVRFENIRVEIDERNPQPRMQANREDKYSANPESRYCPTRLEIVIRKNNYSQDNQRGTVRDVVFADIAVSSPHTPPSSFRGFDAEHGVDGVAIANLRFNGRPISDPQAAGLRIGPHVRQVRFADTASAAKGS